MHKAGTYFFKNWYQLLLKRLQTGSEHFFEIYPNDGEANILILMYTFFVELSYHIHIASSRFLLQHFSYVEHGVLYNLCVALRCN